MTQEIKEKSQKEENIPNNTTRYIPPKQNIIYLKLKLKITRTHSIAIMEN